MTVAIVRATDYQPHVVLDAVKRLMTELGYTEDNPFSSIVKPGDRVFIKPNWVSHEYRRSCPDQDDVYSTITHPALIETVTDLVAIALNGHGEIIVGDNPSIDADFEKLMELTGLRRLERKYDIPCRVLDLRPLRCVDLKDYGLKHKMTPQSGDPEGEVYVNLGKDSQLHGLNPLLFRGVFTDRWETIRHHHGKTQEYFLSKSIVGSDVYISLPKLKTHHKTGTTLNLKGLVGICTKKNCLVHWRSGFPAAGGDEYPDFTSWFRSKFQNVVYRGAWPGNDTIWRMVVDLYTAFNSTRPRRTFSIVDGITGGQGKGPFCPRSKHSEILVGGEDLLEVDCVATKIMGFNPEHIGHIDALVKKMGWRYDDLVVHSKDYDTTNFFDRDKRHLSFDPPPSWAGVLGSRTETGRTTQE